MIWSVLLSIALAGPLAKAGPDLSDARVRLATQLDVLDTMLENGMAEQALAMIGEMHKQGAKDARIDIAKGRAMHQRGLDHDAERVLREVTKKYPGRAEGWAQLGVLLADVGQVPEAVTSLKRAARLAPSDAGIANNLGFVLLAQGDAEGAVDALRDALELEPAATRTRNNLGFALVRLDRYDEAMETFRAAAGEESDARYNFGAACEAAGDRPAAITAYERAISIRPGHSQAVPALSRILKETNK